MERARYLELLHADATLLRAAAARADLGAAVPTCPGWTVRDAVEHVAEVYEHKVAAIELRGQRPEPWPPERPAGRDPLAWFDEAYARLRDTLTRTDPAAPSWTWWPADRTAGFWVRRMAQETAVHRADVESASGPVTPVAADLALDGIDEVLHLMFAGDWTTDPQPDLTGEAAVAAGGASWRIEMTGNDVTVTPGTAATVVSGEPPDVLLWLWGRAGDDAVTTGGDPGVVRRLRARLALATQ